MWFDVDGDGDLDLFVTNQNGDTYGLYRNDRGAADSSGLVDTGGGYCSQNVMPVHVAAADAARVDVEATSMHTVGRRVTKVPGVDPKTSPRPLVVKVP